MEKGQRLDEATEICQVWWMLTDCWLDTTGWSDRDMSSLVWDWSNRDMSSLVWDWSNRDMSSLVWDWSDRNLLSLVWDWMKWQRYYKFGVRLKWMRSIKFNVRLDWLLTVHDCKHLNDSLLILLFFCISNSGEVSKDMETSGCSSPCCLSLSSKSTWNN